MLKQNWTYKKLGEVASFSRGLTFAKNDVVDISSKKVLRSNNIDLVSHSLNFDDVACLKEGFIIPDEKKLHKGDIFICMSNGSTQHLGKVAFIEDDIDYAFGGFMGAIHPDVKEVYPKYVFYSCLSTEYRRFLASILNGININNLKWSELSKFTIPVPPIETQFRIVSELDLLQSIIDKQKAQLKELDNLAQAVFYDMFGDPVENEKGWEVKRLEDLCEVSSAKRVLVEDVVESGIPFLRGTELTALSKVVSSKDVKFTMFITPEHYERVKSITGVPKKGDILIPSINSEGITWVVDTDEPFYFKDGRVIWVHVNIDAFVSQYLSFVISKILKANYTVLTSGATFLELKLFIIRDLIVPIPPLSLQQSFATKIESIEKQKAAINQSIAETQRLFDYTMDKYFG